MKKKGLLQFGLLSLLTMSLFTGCSLGREDKATKKFDNLWKTGTIDYQESTLGIPLDTKDITSVLTDGMFYVCHDGVLYPLFIDYKNYETVTEDYADLSHYVIYNSESVINIPTLFEGDKLYYFSTAGVTDYFTVERFEDLGWSIGLRNLQSTTSQKHVYFNLKENSSNGLTILSNEFQSLNQITDSVLLLDKIGGVRITPDFVEDGIVVGLTPGANYDVEIYNGTNYYYYNADCNVRYFRANELYAFDEYEPLQDYLYEVEIPEYLLTGYYNFNSIGMMRYVKGISYDDFTDFNERLLYQYTSHDKGDDSLKEKLTPYIYSQNPNLNKFKAYDEGYFGYEEETVIVEDEETIFDKLNYFQEASTNEIELWFPKDKECFISISSEETTGSIYLVMENGSRRKLNHNRLNKTYELLVDGKDFKATLEVQGLYNDYTITLTNAESYKGQDAINIDVDENSKTDKKEE